MRNEAGGGQPLPTPRVMGIIKSPLRSMRNRTGFRENRLGLAQSSGCLGLSRTGLAKSPGCLVLDGTGLVPERTAGVISPAGFVPGRMGLGERRDNAV
jgi:hypothetical protein